MRYRRKEEPIPGQKVEKRRKRRWDTLEVTHGFSTWMGPYTIEIKWTVPHITFRRRKQKKKTKRQSKPR